MEKTGIMNRADTQKIPSNDQYIDMLRQSATTCSSPLCVVGSRCLGDLPFILQNNT